MRIKVFFEDVINDLAASRMHAAQKVLDCGLVVKSNLRCNQNI